ncbi:penicillin-binding protein 1C [Vogesella facilis]|uniref:peptidoglycan glycosyltransferase n=1 Tax=Vogesella facilis TaxID=1655232 RepID=A0ABV7RDR5_9NEIS
MRSKRRWAGLLLALCAVPALAAPRFAAVKAAWQPSDVLLLDRHGAPLQQLRVDKRAQRLAWVSLADISPALRYALVLSEDRRFYQHSGVDWSGVAAAAWGNLWHSRTRGASTLTMQLAGLLDEDLRATAGGRSLWQKLGQGWSARALEQEWRKDEILEAYLNLVSFRGEQVGLAAVSQALFGKLPSGLNRVEAAIIVALLRGPNAGTERVVARACGILQAMDSDSARLGGQPSAAADSQRDCARASVLGSQALSYRRAAPAWQAPLAPHFGYKLLQQLQPAAGSRIATTLDAGLQRYATAVLQRHLRALAQRNVQDGAVVVLDNASGDILAWVGSSGRLSSAANVDGVTALRQAGSTLKPFLYQLALERRYLSAASLLDDSPLDMQTAAGLYAPQNYARDFKGPVSVRTALASSLNVPAVRTIAMVGAPALRDRLYALGLSSLQNDGDYYGYSLALGAADVRLLELANAYRTLAQGGLYSAPRWTLAQPRPAPQRRLAAASSFIIADILSDRTARARTFGLESVLSTRYWSAVKTGTSKDMRDNWTLGFSRRYTVGVWVGNAGGEPMWDVSGMHGAAPVWQSVLDYLQRGLASLPPPAPPGVRQQAVRYQGEVEAARQEYFLAGSERRLILPQQAATRAAAGIVAPLDGSIYAVDPDIPPANQRLLLRARGVAGAQWWLDGRRIARGASVPWFPWPGRHRLELRDGSGKLVERVNFEVRGAVAKPGSRAPGAR